LRKPPNGRALERLRRRPEASAAEGEAS
jgi:hypothetical protein